MLFEINFRKGILRKLNSKSVLHKRQRTSQKVGPGAYIHLKRGNLELVLV